MLEPTKKIEDTRYILESAKNGFVVNKTWDEASVDGNGAPHTNYKSNKYVYGTFEEAVEFLNNNPLEVTP